MAGPIVVSSVYRDGASRGLGRTEGRLRSFGRVAGAAGRATAVGLGVAGVAAAALARESVREASATQQSLGATEAVYGRYARSVIRESKRAASSVGVSSNEYRELANVTGALLSSSGLPLKQVTGLTKDLTVRASDMAATFGGSTREAIEAVSAALRGETDPIERYGVAIRQTDIDARLAAKGQSELEGQALKVASAQARVDLILQQTSRTAGQFRRESNTLANQQQILAAKTDNLQARLGKALLPTLTELAVIGNQRVLPFLNRMVGDFESGEGRVGAFGDAFRGAVADVKAGRNPLGDLGEDLGVVIDAARDAGPELRAAASELPSLGDFAKVAGVGIEFLADNADTLAKNLPLLVAAYGLYKGVQLASNAAVALSPALRLAEVSATRQQTVALRELAAAQRAAAGGGGVAVGGRRGGSPIAAIGADAAAATGKVSRFGRAAGVAGGAAGLGLLAAGAATGEGALSTLSSVGGGALLGFQVGGPIGAAVGGTAGLLLDLATNAGTAEDAAVTGAEQWKAYASTLDQVTGATTEATAAMAFQQLADAKVLGTLSQLGISNRTAVNSVLGRADASRQVAAVLDGEREVVDRLQQQYDDLKAAANTEGAVADPTRDARLAALREEIDTRRSAINTIDEQTGATERAINETRRQAAATREFTGSLKGVPKEVRTQIRANEIEPTRRGIKGLIDQYDLTPKQVRTVIRAAGIATNERQVRRLSKVLRGVGNVRPNLVPWQRGIGAGINLGQRIAGRGANQINRDLRGTGRGARPNLGGWRGGILAGVRVGERAAGQGTNRINRQLSQGTRQARPDLNPFTRFFNQGMGRAGQTARRGTEQINQQLRSGTARSRADLGPFNSSVQAGISAGRGIASSGGSGVGAALKAGVLAGFSGTASALASAAASAVTQAIAAARAAARSRSPSRETYELGQDLGEGAILGLNAKGKTFNRAGRRFVRQLLAAAGNDVRSVRDQLAKIADAAGPNKPRRRKGESDKAYNARVKNFEKRERAYERRVNAATKALAKKSKRLVENARNQDRLNRKLEAAEERLDSLREARDEYVRSVKASFLDFGGLGSIAEGHLNSPEALNAQRQALVKQAERFDSAIRALRGRLNDADLKALVEAGPGQGLAAAEALVAGGSAAIAETNRLQKRLAELGGNLGDRLGLDYYQAGIDAQRKLVQGIRGDLRQAERTGDEIAESLLRAFQSKVGIGGKAAANAFEFDAEGKARLSGSYETLGRASRAAFLNGLGKLPSQPASSGSGSKSSTKLTAVMEPLAVKQIATAASSGSKASAAKITQKLDQVASATRSVQDRLSQVAQRVNEPRSTDVRVTVGAGDLSAILAGRAVTKVVRDSKKAGKG